MWGLICVTVVLTTVVIGALYYRYIRESHATNPAYNVAAIVQTSSEGELLQTVYLAELMELSINKPINLYRFNTKEAQSKLLASPLIKSASVKRVRPGTVHVDYAPRHPIAYLIDYSNTALDKEGYPFPFKPFFTPKNLPEIYLGLSVETVDTQALWNQRIADKRMVLALEILNYVTKYYATPASHVKRVDVSQAFAPSCGQRQIVVVMEDWKEQDKKGRSQLFQSPRILRLGFHTYKQGLANYKVLRGYFLQQEVVGEYQSKIVKLPMMTLDLRVDDLAFICYE